MSEGDITRDDIKILPFQEVTAVGTVNRAVQKNGGTDNFAEIDISYVDINEELQTIESAIWLGKAGEPISGISRRLLNELFNATDSNTLSATVGKRVRFTAKPQKKDTSQPNYTKFESVG